MHRRLLGLIVATFIVSTGVVEAAPSAFDFKSGTLADGAHYFLREGAGEPAVAIDLWYRVPSYGIIGTPKPSLARVTAQALAASHGANTVSLGRAIAQVGGSLSINVFPTSTEVSVTVPTADAPAMVHTLTQTFFAPAPNLAGLKRASGELSGPAAQAQYDPIDVLRDQVFESMFADGPAHVAPLAANDLSKISIDDVDVFAKYGFAPKNAVIVLSGPLDDDILSSVATGADVSTLPQPQMLSTDSTLVGSAKPVTIPGPVPGIGLGWAGPPISDEISATAMDFLADYLFHPTDGTVTRYTDLQFPAVVASGQFVTLRDSGVLEVAIAGDHASDVRSVLQDEILHLRTPMSREQFAAAISAFTFHIESDIQLPNELAASIGWYAVEGAPNYAPGNGGVDGMYLRRVAMLTPESVAAAARKYLGETPVEVTLTPLARGGR